MSNESYPNQKNDEILAEQLDRVLANMQEMESPWPWFEERGISEEAARALGDQCVSWLLSGILPQSIGITMFVAGYSMCEGKTEKAAA